MRMEWDVILQIISKSGQNTLDIQTRVDRAI